MLAIAFLTLSIITVLLAAAVVQYHQARTKALLVFGIISFSWLIYLYFIARSGVLANFSLPPRLPVLVMLPAILGIIYISGRKAFLSILQRVPVYLPVMLQSFRILVELLIYRAYIEDILPRQVTFDGNNYDITVGITAVAMGLLAFRYKVSNRLLMAWNIFGLTILTFTALTFMRTYYLDGAATAVQREMFIRFPFILLAAVMLPTAVGLHIISIRQLQQQKKQVRHDDKLPHTAPAVLAVTKSAI